MNHEAGDFNLTTRLKAILKAVVRFLATTGLPFPWSS